MAYQTKAFIQNSQEDRSKVIERMKFLLDRLVTIEKEQGSVNKELQEYLEEKIADAVGKLSKYLKSSDVVEMFTSLTLDYSPDLEESWEVAKPYIQTTLVKCHHGVIVAWEKEHHVFADACTSLIQYFQQRLNFVERQIQNLESSVLEENAASLADSTLGAESLTVTERVISGVTTAIWAPFGLAVLLVSAPVVGVMAIKEKWEDWVKRKQFEKDKFTFMENASKTYISEVAEEKNVRSYVVEQLNRPQYYLDQVVARIPKLIKAAKMLCQQLRDENRSQEEIEDFYQPLHKRSLLLRERMALFGIKEVHSLDISCSDLKWNDDGSSLLGTGSFAYVYRGKLRQRGKDKPVALKVWKDELNDSNASAFLAETEMMRYILLLFKWKSFFLSKDIYIYTRGNQITELRSNKIML